MMHFIDWYVDTNDMLTGIITVALAIAIVIAYNWIKHGSVIPK